MALKYLCSTFAEKTYGAQLFFDAVSGADLTHSYKAQRQRNGSYCIKNVDIFSACSRLNKATNKNDDFNEAWLNAAVQRFNELKTSDSYLPPVHIDHHGASNNTPTFAGKINALRLGRNSKGIATIFADVVDIPAQVFAEIAQGNIPYRSVEINNPDNPEISSLAFMATTVPYFKMPIMNVQLETGTSSTGSHFGTGANDAKVCFAEVLADNGVKVEVIQRFDADYKPLNQRTAAAQKFYDMGGMSGYGGGGMGGSGYGGGQEQSFRRPQRGGGGSGGGRQQQDDGDGDFDSDLTDEELAEILAHMQMQQQGGQDQQGLQGQQQSMPDGMGGQSMPGMGDDMEAMMSQPSGQQILQQGFAQLGQQLQSMQQGIQAILAGPAITPQASPPPTVSSEPTGNRQQFAATPNQAAAPQNGAASNDIAILFRELNGLKAAFTAEVENRKKLEADLNQLYFEQAVTKRVNFLESQATPYFNTLRRDMDAAGYKGENFANTFGAIEQRWVKFSEEVATTLKPEDFEKLNVGQFFAEERRTLPNIKQIQAATPTTAAPATVTPTSATPTTTAAPSAANPNLVQQFKEAKTLNDRERAEVVQMFAETNPQRADFAEALPTLKKRWDDNAVPKSIYHNDFNVFAYSTLSKAAAESNHSGNGNGNGR